MQTRYLTEQRSRGNAMGWKLLGQYDAAFRKNSGQRNLNRCSYLFRGVSRCRTDTPTREDDVEIDGRNRLFPRTTGPVASGCSSPAKQSRNHLPCDVQVSVGGIGSYRREAFIGEAQLVFEGLPSIWWLISVQVSSDSRSLGNWRPNGFPARRDSSSPACGAGSGAHS